MTSGGVLGGILISCTEIGVYKTFPNLSIGSMELLHPEDCQNPQNFLLSSSPTITISCRHFIAIKVFCYSEDVI